MFHIYTPKQWFSIFDVESLTIDDDGYIYEGYKQAFSTPIGKVDFIGGHIFGPDYAQIISANPIGKIVEKGDTMFVYGPDYLKSSAVPMFYIKDSKIYDYAEYGKWIPNETAYIKDDRIEEQKRYEAEKKTGKVKYNAPSFGGSSLPFLAVGLFFIGGFLLGGVHMLMEAFVDPQYNDVKKYLIVGMILSLIVVAIFYYYVAYSFVDDIIEGTKISVVVMTFIVDVYIFIDAIQRGYSMFKAIFFGFVVGSLVDAFVCLVPSIIICVLVWIVVIIYKKIADI